MLSYSCLCTQQLSIQDIINDIELKYPNYNKKILSIIYNYVFRNKTYLNNFVSYFWVKNIIFNEIKCLYDLECCLILFNSKLPNEIVGHIRLYIETNFINDFFLI